MANEKQWTPCPSCGQKPSARGTVYVPHRGGRDSYVKTCDDPIHVKADAGPALYGALENAVQVIEQLVPEPSARGVADVVLFQARAALASARAETKP